MSEFPVFRSCNRCSPASPTARSYHMDQVRQESNDSSWPTDGLNWEELATKRAKMLI